MTSFDPFSQDKFHDFQKNELCRTHSEGRTGYFPIISRLVIRLSIEVTFPVCRNHGCFVAVTSEWSLPSKRPRTSQESLQRGMILSLPILQGRKKNWRLLSLPRTCRFRSKKGHTRTLLAETRTRLARVREFRTRRADPSLARLP